jgi:hypothetical protein
MPKMAHYLISYDLHKQRNYQPVWDKLEAWGAVRLLESLWVVTRNSTANQIRDDLKAAIDSDDSIAILELKSGSGWSTWNARKSGIDWLKKNILA